MRRRYETLSILIPESDEPPREFRIFAAGKSTTRKGPVLFDEEAAKKVMSAYAVHGVLMMVDLEHLSLDEEHPNYDPDARAWFNLELRNGELWAVNVRWTPDGEERVRNKKQIYISPAFIRENKTGRVLELINVAICGMPATDRIAPLIAASGYDDAADRGDNRMKEAICKLLGLPPEATDEEVLAKIQELKAVSEEMKKKLAGPTDDKSNEAMSLLKRIEAVESKQEVRDLVAANRRKLNGSAQEQWALKQSPGALRDFFANAPEIPEHVRLTEKKKDPPKDEVSLTDAEREICKHTGVSESDLIAHKRAEKGMVS